MNCGGELVMTFFIECVAACVLFTVMLEILSAKRREIFVNDYPPVVTDRLRGRGSVLCSHRSWGLL